MTRKPVPRRPAKHFGAEEGAGDLALSASYEGVARLAREGRLDIETREDLAAGGPPPATTQVADGLPRRAFTVDEVERMIQVGILREPEPFELIGGDLVAMAPKDRRSLS
jgi:hypothetical protein